MKTERKILKAEGSLKYHKLNIKINSKREIILHKERITREKNKLLRYLKKGIKIMFEEEKRKILVKKQAELEREKRNP